MKAALLMGPGKIEITEAPTPVLRFGEVLVRVRAAGVCGSDYAKWQGAFGEPYGIAPGHEGAGEVAAVGPGVADRREGDRVVIQPNIPCGGCPVCLRGRENLCPRKIRLGIDASGVFAEYVAVPARLVWPIPANLSFTEAVLAEPLAVALHGFGMIPTSEEEEALIYGAGAIGLFYVRLAALAGARVAALDIAPPRLEAARKLGAAQVFASLEEIKASGLLFDTIYETSGKKDALSQAVNLAAPGGRILLCGLPKEDYPLATTAIVRKELTLQGAIIYQNEFPEALELLSTRKVPADLFITGHHVLAETASVIEDFPSPQRIKEIISLP